MCTTDLAEFGTREIAMLRDILNEWIENGLPLSFNNNEVTPTFDKYTGYVFLTNAEGQIAMLDPYDNSLSIYHSCPECGKEGFAYDLREEGNGSICCHNYLDKIQGL